MRPIYTWTKKKLWTFFVFALLSDPLMAAISADANGEVLQQQEITGTITDISTGEALVGTNSYGTVDVPHRQRRIAVNNASGNLKKPTTICRYAVDPSPRS